MYTLYSTQVAVLVLPSVYLTEAQVISRRVTINETLQYLFTPKSTLINVVLL